MKNYTFFTLQILFSSLILLLVASCKRDANSGDEPLCSARTENTSNALRLGGFYYLQTESSEDLFIYILNKNGTIGRASFPGPLASAEEFVTSINFLSSIVNSKTYWGVYHISGSNIHIDTWHVDSNGKDYGYRWSGEILSDTSFIITSNSLCDGSEYESYNRLYYFYPMSNKPDSVTSLIP